MATVSERHAVGGGDDVSVECAKNVPKESVKVYFKETIGKGSFGKVKYCVAHFPDRRVGLAVKIIVKNSTAYRTNESAVKREISILEKVRHENLITFYKICDQQKCVYLYMEYCKNGDMAQMIRKNGPYTEPDAKVLFAQIVSAIEYLHGIDVAHRDLKPENVLLNHQNKVKVADFGLADYCRDSRDGRRVLSHTRCGTKMYMPPEVLKNPKDGYNAIFFDIWSMGGVLHYMLTGLVPFDGKQRTEIVKQQLARDIVMFRPRHLLMSSTSVKILIQKILEPDVLKRARISVIKRSEWLAGT